ncbi:MULTISPECIES: molybdopterin synthase sulfur carrier subunit [Gilliamella]|jgi:Molybdopterin converting factor, small subunit|uniref:Molybdopterin synthase sulfur carrier subunit n=1 Tax=Gilliamella apicola TaxID=1196095 RepID=A0A556SQS0_9GAMM|nr:MULTISPECIES: molybdopterin synthase sulfur carrier subunit [Gilliamella]KES19146.1 Molybdopterin converting factor, small subunit [Gilliamella apicola SCGC AB-598-B02]MBI0027105.1 molybdopterin synthase sulfur carrier subunit [Gilliamella sp. B14448G7]MBI0034254.1 molybdopterin synthase sulfur carrier subunit [Gilliamella sp. B14448G11]MBI0041989.1 molybdopterin synthase sulfur carrier subunit [Gilliamella sp. B14448G12]MBI0094742.1 molybdopterin synthase sulfur carrier subunit [Gilliamell
MNKIIFFAQIRELVEIDSIILDANQVSILELLEQLSKRGDRWALAFKERVILCAVNQVLVDSDYIIQAGDEIAFFPPVTGG